MPSSLDSPGAADSSIWDRPFAAVVPGLTRRARPSAPPDPLESERLDLIHAQRGDRAALDRLLARHVDRLFSMCIRMVGDREAASDLLQDALVRIIGGLQHFRGESQVGTWMTRITVNTCLSHHRKRRSRPEVALEAIPQDTLRGTPKGGREPDHTQVVEERELQERVERAFAELDPNQRAIVMLRDLHNMDYDQIAEVLDVPVGTVKSRLFRARLALREHVERSAAGTRTRRP